MDQELKEYLDEMKRGLLDEMKREWRADMDRAAEAFATQLSQLRTEVREGFDRVDRRLDLQGLMLSSNTKALGGLLENTVTLESEYKQTRKEIGELRERVGKLEGGKAA